MTMTTEMLRARQALDLDSKITLTQVKVREWYEHWNGDVYVSFSGGKDSTVLRHIVKGLYPWVPAVFCDTGLEYPEVRAHARKYADVVLRPEMTFKQVIEQYGYPVVSKAQARMINILRHPTEKNAKSRRLAMTGKLDSGKRYDAFRVSDRWLPLVHAPFEVSDMCCAVMKKRPFKKYEKETGQHPIIGMMAEESEIREKSYKETGCNAFDSKRPRSMPLGFWTEQDVLQYLKRTGIEYPSVYGEIVTGGGGSLCLTGEKRTGCMFCMFGVQLDGTPNKFQRMAETHPKQYAYCMKTLGLRRVLDYMHIPADPQPSLFDDHEMGV